MGYVQCNSLPQNVLSLPTYKTASGSMATFNTDMTENLIECVCDIQYSQASGTPTPSNPIPITVYNALNLSHSGADTSNPTITNIPFGQTVANGVLDVLSGKLTITHNILDLGSVSYTYSDGDKWFYNGTSISNVVKRPDTNDDVADIVSEMYSAYSRNALSADDTLEGVAVNRVGTLQIRNLSYTDPTAFKTAMSGVKFVYELETPTVVQLTSTQVQALLNKNNIWCDTGDTSVKYILSVNEALRQN